jgi:predicted RNA-binding Zn-ribbon protein involved in translation (DUF1610 family)
MARKKDIYVVETRSVARLENPLRLRCEYICPECGYTPRAVMVYRPGWSRADLFHYIIEAKTSWHCPTCRHGMETMALRIYKSMVPKEWGGDNGRKD